MRCDCDKPRRYCNWRDINKTISVFEIALNPNLPVMNIFKPNLFFFVFVYIADDMKFKWKVEMPRCECEAKGESSMYSQLQPFSPPELTELVGKLIDVLCSFGINIKKGPTGEVLEVAEGAWDPTVRVKWDLQLDARGYEDSTITKQRLLPSRWRKNEEDGWRIDVAIDIESEIDNESDKDDKDEGGGDRLEFGTNSGENPPL